MNEHERVLAIFGTILTSAALVLSITTEVSARRRVAEYREFIARGATVAQQGSSGGPAATADRHVDGHIGYEQQTLASRWSIPDGHGTLGAGFAIFGIILVAVPRATARKRVAG